MITQSKFHLVRLDITGQQFPKASVESVGFFDSEEAAKSSVEKHLDLSSHIFWHDRENQIDGELFAGSALFAQRTQYCIFPIDCESDG
jgi:hypothetical protein